MRKKIIKFQNKIDYNEKNNIIYCYTLNNFNIYQFDKFPFLIEKLKIDFFENISKNNIYNIYDINKNIFFKLMDKNEFPFLIYINLSIDINYSENLLFKIVIENEYKPLLKYFANLLSSFLSPNTTYISYLSENKKKYENLKLYLYKYKNKKRNMHIFEEFY